MKFCNVCISLVSSLSLCVPFTLAQRGGRGGGSPAAGGPVDITATRAFDKPTVERGGKVFAAQCASCHGDNARGGNGKTGADLIRSSIVQMDHGGRELPEFLKFGRPEKGMPKFDLSHDEGVDVATWLHYEVSVAADRGAYHTYDRVGRGVDRRVGYVSDAVVTGSVHQRRLHAIKPSTAGTGVSTVRGTLTGSPRPLLKRDARS